MRTCATDCCCQKVSHQKKGSDPYFENQPLQHKAKADKPEMKLLFTFEQEVIWNQMRPLYEKLHAFVRYRLREFFGADRLAEDEPIPAHL